MKMKSERAAQKAAVVAVVASDPSVAAIIRAAKQPKGRTPYLLQKRAADNGILECYVIIEAEGKYAAIKIDGAIYRYMQRDNKEWHERHNVGI